MATEDKKPQLGAGWDEAQCIAGLAQLETLRQQLDDLRLAIPRVVDTLNLPPSPAMFVGFKRSINQSQNDIRALKTRWNSPEVQSIFEHTRESLSKNSDLSANAQVPQYGWVERDASQRQAAKRKNKSAQDLEEPHVSLSKSDVSRVVDDFRKSHPNIKVSTSGDNYSLMIQFVSGSLNLRFNVGIEQQEANDRYKLNAECLGMAEPFLSITRCILCRPQTNDLQHLLDMIVAYETVKAPSCAKCSRLLDGQLLVPTARRSKQTSSAKDKLETVWQALHESCLE